MNEKMSENIEKEAKKDPMQEIMKFSRKVNTLSKFVDYVANELIPTVFRNNVVDVYRNSSKLIDNIIRNL